MQEVTVKHLQSATQIVSLGEISILTDPWLTEGEYYGSWFHYPPFDPDEIVNLRYDFIYVSHVHPDHCSEKTFEKLNKNCSVLIHEYRFKFLKRKLESWGFNVIELENAVPFVLPNGAEITIYAADNCDPTLCQKFMGCGSVEGDFGSTQIDSFVLFQYRSSVILNTNDCPFELASKAIVAHRIQNLSIDLLFLGYGGAGPYPQCFDFENEETLKARADEKKEKFLLNAYQYLKLLQPEHFIPFAGTYLLGSRLMSLNEYRGIPTLAEAVCTLNALAKDPNWGFVMESGDEIQLSDFKIIKNKAANKLSLEEYLNVIQAKPLDYDDDEWNESELPDLVNASYDRFIAKAREIGFDTKFSVNIQTEKISILFGIESPPILSSFSEVSQFGPIVRIKLDHSLLHRLIRGPRFAHWNNAEIGSHLKFFRDPDIFERGLYHCMCFFHK